MGGFGPCYASKKKYLKRDKRDLFSDDIFVGDNLVAYPKYVYVLQ